MPQSQIHPGQGKLDKVIRAYFPHHNQRAPRADLQSAPRCGEQKNFIRKENKPQRRSQHLLCAPGVLQEASPSWHQHHCEINESAFKASSSIPASAWLFSLNHKAAPKQLSGRALFPRGGWKISRRVWKLSQIQVWKESSACSTRTQPCWHLPAPFCSAPGLDGGPGTGSVGDVGHMSCGIRLWGCGVTPRSL